MNLTDDERNFLREFAGGPVTFIDGPVQMSMAMFGMIVRLIRDGALEMSGDAMNPTFTITQVGKRALFRVVDGAA